MFKVNGDKLKCINIQIKPSHFKQQRRRKNCLFISIKIIIMRIVMIHFEQICSTHFQYNYNNS